MEQPDFKTLSTNVHRFIHPPPQGYNVWRDVCAMLPPATRHIVSAASPALRLEALGTSITRSTDLHGRLWWWKQLPAVSVHLFNPVERDVTTAFDHLRMEILRIDVTPLANLSVLDASTAATQKEFLRKIDLNGCDRVGDRHVEHFPMFRFVTAVRLIGCGAVETAGMVSLASMASLELLVLGGCGDVTNAGIAALSQAPKLRYLTLQGVFTVTPDGLLPLCHMDTLIQLSLGSTMVSLEPFLAQLASNCCSGTGSILQRLVLNPSGLSVEAVKLLCTISSLEHLSVSMYSTVCNDESLLHIHQLISLKSLLLRDQPEISKVSLGAIAQLSHLTTLDISYCKGVTSDAFAQLGALVKLRTFYVEGHPKLTDNDMTIVLTPMTHMMHLKLNGCRLLTHKTLVLLRGMKYLRTLGLRSCVGMAGSFGVDQLKAARSSRVDSRGRELTLLVDQ
ncbi:Hypothetical protein, putative [Bodo saltans]|uniref:Uncharacterized protein n=1 Tax=Bodo saltans TaxID=75058 RepID=A0A0S4J562_BODSA|nr:Hypothetical protein, putative [Bodo saltans]|eukprot:CUG84628.1 Hypothetical protein, putative [Bodo saltans]